MNKIFITMAAVAWCMIASAQYQLKTGIKYSQENNEYAKERCELELYGRYEEQAYFWRMMKLTGHIDVTLYEMQGYDHGAMPQPSFHIVKHHIKRILGE